MWGSAAASAPSASGRASDGSSVAAADPGAAGEGGGEYTWSMIAVDLATSALGYGALYLCVRGVMEMMDPMRKDKQAAASRRAAWSARMARHGREPVETNEYEDIIAGDIVEVEQMEVGFDEIGGLEEQKRAIYELAILPLKRPDIFRGNALISAPTGILVYGPPGTGKTMLAKAVARESGATFIDLKMSTVMNKWFGESQKLVRAVFTLAHKLAPTIVFIDEVDGFMRARGQGGDSDSTALLNMKAEFMQLWDGLSSASGGPGGSGGGGGKKGSGSYGVLVIGATNRPYDVDAAILRRMPSTFEVGLPGEEARRSILRILLREQPGFARAVDCAALAGRTGGYSGCDLKELCRAAAMLPVREAMAALQHKPVATRRRPRRVDDEGESEVSEEEEDVEPLQVRPLAMRDFDIALEGRQPPAAAAEEYGARDTARNGGGGGGGEGAMVDFADAIQAMMAAAAQQQQQQQQRHRNTGSVD